MNELVKKRIKMIVFFSTIGVLSFTLMAKPVLKTVKAYFNPSISYTLDGEKVLEEVKTLTYDNKTYVPLADIGILMGLQAKFENNTVIMITTPTTTDGVYTVTSEDAQTVIVHKAIIKEVKVENKTITILKKGDEDKTQNYTILNISDATKIIHEKEAMSYALIDLKTDMMVSVKHSSIMTSSVPEETAAFEIKILAQDDEDNQEVRTSFKDVKILEVNNRSKYIVIETEEGQLKVTFDNKTKIKFEKAKNQPNANALKVNQIVDIKFENSEQSTPGSHFERLEIIVKEK